MSDTQTFDPMKSISAQLLYVDKNQFPHFAPSDGGCYVCKQNIYKQITVNGRKTGISVERAGSTHVTGCPHCNRSFCD